MTGKCIKCGRTGQIKRGMCMAHYTAWWRARTPEERRRPTTAERYWAKVDKRGPDECWPWIGSHKASGHGEFCITRDNRVPAGVYALYLHDGTERPEGLHALHHCDNPPCVNPAHLYYGTPRDNADDRVTRGREPLGTKRPNARLTDDIVVQLRKRFAAGEYMTDLAQEFGITTGLLSNVVNGFVWKHAGGPLTTGKRHGWSGRRDPVEPKRRAREGAAGSRSTAGAA